eukprot:15436605-Alexandrium_andersonii.AAC.1
MGPPGIVPGQAAFQAACRLRSTGLGPKGTAALLVETRPADEGGRPMGANTRYVSAGAVKAGAWLDGSEQSFGRRCVHPASRAAVEAFWAARPRTADATEGLGLDIAAAGAALPRAADGLIERTDVEGCGTLDVFLFKEDVWYLQLGRGAVINVAGAGETAVMPILADSWVRLQGPAAQRPSKS